MVFANDVEAVLRAAGVPLIGVSVPSDDKATWRVDFAPDATQAQRDQAAALIAAFTPPTPNTLIDRDAEIRTGEKALTAVALALWECIPAPTMTKAQLKARAKAIFKTL